MPLSGSLLALALCTAAGAPKAVVLLAPEDRVLVLGPVVSAIQSQLSDLSVELRVEPVPKLQGSLAGRMEAAGTVQGALAVIWLDLNPGEPIFVYVADPASHRLFARNVDWDPGGGHFAASGLVVRSAVQALLAGRSIGFEAPASPGARPDGPDPFPPVAAEQGLTAAVRVGYSPATFASDVGALHGAELALQLGYGPHFYAAASYRLFPSFLLRDGEYSIAVFNRHPVSLASGARVALGRFQLGLELAGTLDLVRVEVHVLQEFQVGPAPQTLARWLIGPTAWASFRLAGSLSAVATMGFDLPLGARDYIIAPANNGDPIDILTLGSVQSRASLGLRWDLL